MQDVPGRSIGCSSDVFHAVSTGPGEPATDCPACGDTESVGRFTTVYAVYFFCSSCGHAWWVEQPLTCEHSPERRRNRAPRAIGNHSD
jgi:hypothetical protein